MPDFQYFRVSSRFWGDEKEDRWDDDARLLALYLLTCPHRTVEGLFRLPKPYILGDLGWEEERLAKPFAQLLQDRFIDYDETARVMLLRNALKYQTPDNENMVKAALKKLELLPATPLLSEFRGLAKQYCERLAQGLAERYGNPQTLSQALSQTPEDSTRSRARDPSEELRKIHELQMWLTRYSGEQWGTVLRYWEWHLRDDGPHYWTENRAVKARDLMRLWDEFEPSDVTAAINVHLAAHPDKPPAYTAGILRGWREEATKRERLVGERPAGTAPGAAGAGESRGAAQSRGVGKTDYNSVAIQEPDDTGAADS